MGLRFTTDSTRCAGSNFTFTCSSYLNKQRLFISRRIHSDNSGNYSLRILAESKYTKFAVKDTKNKLTSYQFADIKPVTLSITNLTADDAGVYQCHSSQPWQLSKYMESRMTLQIADCSPPKAVKEGFDFNILTLALGFPISLLVILLIFVSVWMRFCRSKMERRRLVVVQPSANAIYCDSEGTLSTVGSATALLTPLRPPEVLVQRRFGRSGSTSTRWVRSRATHILYELPEQAGWEIERAHLSVGEDLGEGAFGVVRRGLLAGADVAVKTLKPDFSEEELTGLVKEMEVMKLLEPHPNIIRLIGVCTRDGPPAIINEFAPYGNLRDFLRARRPGIPERAALPRGLLMYRHLIDFAIEAANGLDYLATRHVIHRDIAARNVLVGVGFQAKVADFGLSRHVANYYRKTTEGRLPVKWLAPEALFDHVFTRESDVWSYGILLWEIFSLGGSPYPSIPVERLFVMLSQGFRNEPPFYAFPLMYQVMRRCWAQDPMERPSFAELRRDLERLRGVEEYAQLLRDSPIDSSEHYLSMEA